MIESVSRGKCGPCCSVEPRGTTIFEEVCRFPRPRRPPDLRTWPRLRRPPGLRRPPLEVTPVAKLGDGYVSGSLRIGLDHTGGRLLAVELSEFGHSACCVPRRCCDDPCSGSEGFNSQRHRRGWHAEHLGHRAHFDCCRGCAQRGRQSGPTELRPDSTLTTVGSLSARRSRRP